MEKAAKFEELIAKVTEDVELQKKCAAAIKDGKGDELLKEMGYDFSLEELTAYIEEKYEDMTAEELEQVAGGRRSFQDTVATLLLKALVNTFGIGSTCKL